MRTLILVALFSLVIIINAQFGDVIAFPRIKDCPFKKPVYKHYAVYVGNETIPGKAADEDIFHRTGDVKKAGAKCIFGKLSKEGTNVKDNYLDAELPVGDHDTILRRIMEKKDNCEEYSLYKNNCEHLATYVRYGKKRSEQHDTCAAKWTYFCSNEKRRRRDDTGLTPDLETVSCEELCTGSAGGKPGLNVLSLSLPLLLFISLI